MSNVAQPLVQASLIGEAIDRGPVIVLVSDEERNYVAVNGLACELLGYTREELLARKAPKDPGRLRRKDGTVLELEHRSQPTTIAGLALFVSVCWPAAGPQLEKRSRRSAPARA